MTRDEPTTVSNRRQFLKLVGTTGAAATGLTSTVAADLDTDSAELQEALVVFDDNDDVDRLAELDLAEGFYGYEVLPIGYAPLTGDQLSTIAGWDEVRRVVPNRELEYEHDDARPDTGASDVHAGEGLDVPYTGENVHAAVIDTGLDGAHPDFEGRIAANWHWAGDPLAEEDDLWVDAGLVNTDDVGHGTHCAGSIGADGTQSDGEYAGMAPGATITSYSANATLSVLKATSAYDHLLSLQRSGEHEIHIVSNSYGAGAGEFDPFDPLNVATWFAYEADVLVTWSAGNDGDDTGTMGQRKHAPYTLSVGATNADQSVADFSSRGYVEGNYDRKAAFENMVSLYEGVPEDELDGPLGIDRIGLVAKGASVMSTLNPAHPLQAYDTDTETWYGLISGTSMSNPVAAGCAALVIDAYVENCGEVPDPIDVINTLEATADAGAIDDLEDPTGDAEYTVTNVGTGYVDAHAAVQRAEDGDLAAFDEVDLA